MTKSLMTKCKFWVAAIVAAVVVSCATSPIKPGVGVIRSTSGMIAAVQQSENPKSDSTQKYRRVTEAPCGAKTTEEVETRVGAAQKDMAREAAAKLASLRPVMYIGILVFLVGTLSIFWPPLKVVVGSMTTSAAIAAGGLALVVLPTLIVGNELLIFGGVAVGIALWFLAHRHGKTRGELEVLKKL